MSFPKYPEYKDSEITWIGDVPTYWEVKPFKWLLSNNEGGVWGDDPTGEGDTLVLRSTDQTVDGNWKLTDPAPRKLSAKEKASALLVEGDLVVTKSSGSSLHIGKTTLVTADIARQGCCYGNFMQRLRVNSGFTPKLAWYVMNNELARAQLDLLSNSTTGLANLNGTLIGEILLPVSTIAEQTQIARFLDHETARIDALIEEQQRLIELLKEKRQAVISHAVTKGLDPTVPMKDSGVEWLGEVPCSWRVIKFGITHDKAELGGNYEAGESEEGLPLIKMGNIGRGKIKLDKVEYVSLTQDIDNGHTLKEGDFLFNTRNSLDLVGKVCVWRSELQAALYNSNILRIYFNKNLVGSSGFVNYLLNSNLGLEQLRLIARGTTSVAAIYYKDLSSLSFAFPLPSEQREIERFLDIQTSQLDALVNAAEQTIDLIKERRSALISAAVTGKIDVRGWQPSANAATPELAQEAV